jgi:glycosyltransferase involved in cell wall biosynthesis
MTLAQFSAHGDRVLCFHGLPPLFPNEGEILVFQQNRNHFGMVQLDAFSWKTRQRIRFEQFVAYVFRRRCASYWVQTPSMAQSLKKWYGDESVEVHVLPFLMPVASANAPGAPQRDFIYVADGEGHKNHRRLIEAWVILAKQNVFPTLALTLSRRDSSLLAWIHSMIERYDLRVSNLGQLPHEALVAEYVHSNALIFPSVSESFGLPLLEARELGLRIVASELDFVRDVCEPIETFDPYAPVSIARAVRRFLGHRESVVEPVSASLFLSTLLSSNS